MADNETPETPDTSVEGAEAPEAQDPIKNLKAEMSRKLSNTESRLQQMLAQQAELNQKLAEIAATRFKPENQKDESEELDIYDAKSVQRAIDRRVSAEAERVKSEVAEQNKQQQVLAQLAVEYPELQDGSSELSLAAVRAFQGLDPSIRGTAAGYKLAVREAAAEVGLVPASKRRAPKSSDSEFTGLGGNGITAGRNSSASKKAADLDDNTVVIAQLMGIDINDKKKMDAIKKRANSRKNWSKYEE